jgi:hypothetical protein
MLALKGLQKILFPDDGSQAFFRKPAVPMFGEAEI